MSWSTATEAFAAKLPGYEARAEQDRLALGIEDNVLDGQNMLAQAGCGTGKSFAYLVTAIAQARRTGKPSVIATATKALQAQLADKDLPFLASVLGDVRFSVLKGRGNYVCLAKLNSDEAAQVPNVAQIREELESDDEHSGDIEAMITEVDPKFRLKLTVSADECPGKRECTWGDVCYAERAKERAQDAHVVVANHALLMRDALVKELTDGMGSILPNYGGLFVDEAHELEDYATNALGNEFTQRAITRFGDDAATFLGDTHANDGLRSAARVLFDTLDDMLGRESTLALDDVKLAKVSDELLGTLEAVNALRTKVYDFRPTGDGQSIKHKQMKRRADGMRNRLTSIIMAESDELVRWAAREERMFKGEKEVQVKLAYAPLHVGPHLRRLLWEDMTSVLTSATLAVGNDFSYIASRLGIEDYVGFDAGSPFDFAKQAGLYIPAGNFPSPKEASWGTRVIAETGELVRQAGGRALLLFTSRRAMNNSYEALAPGFQKMGLTVLRQGDAPNGRLAEEFKNDETSVLFALKSFMTGADFQGDTLRLVVLDKLPFAVPDDVIVKAREDAHNAAAKPGWKNQAFSKIAIPSMVLILLQAFGRAIRTRNDEALVAIFDNRIKVANWGRDILRAMPNAKRIDDLGGAMGYLGELAERRDA